MARDFKTLVVETPYPHVLCVKLNRPPVNAINTQMATELRDFWRDIESAPDEFRCIVLTGAGKMAFCAGGDLKERDGMSDEEWTSQHRVFESAVRAHLNSPIPILAAVNGFAYGGGLELALCCDFTYSSSSARFALPEVGLGIMPGAGGTQTLARCVGERRAKELIFTGESFSADDAMAWGVINKVVVGSRLLETAFDTARRIAANSPAAVQRAKLAIHYGLQADLYTGLRLELRLYATLIPSVDRRKGVRAFNDRRRPGTFGD